MATTERSRVRPRLALVRRPDGWWVAGLPDASAPEKGPYATRAAAAEARRGSWRFFARLSKADRALFFEDGR